MTILWPQHLRVTIYRPLDYPLAIPHPGDYPLPIHIFVILSTGRPASIGDQHFASPHAREAGLLTLYGNWEMVKAGRGATRAYAAYTTVSSS